MDKIISHNLKNNETSTDFTNTLMLDVARRHMSKEDIIDCIDSISLGTFQKVMLHLSDNEGFALDILDMLGYDVEPSDIYGWLSCTDLDDIIYAAHINDLDIILDVDVPSHCKALIDTLGKENIATIDESTLDYTDKRVVSQLIIPLYTELKYVFNTKYYMIGADEVPGGVDNALDLAHLINVLSSLLDGEHSHIYVWNDSLNQDVLGMLMASNVKIVYWEDSDVNTLDMCLSTESEIINASAYNYYFNVSDITNNLYIKSRLSTLDISTCNLVALWGEESQKVSNKDLCNFIENLENSQENKA